MVKLYFVKYVRWKLPLTKNTQYVSRDKHRKGLQRQIAGTKNQIF